MNTSKIIRAVVGSGRYTETAAITKEDYGRILKIEGIELPETYEIDFSNDRKEGTSVTMIGNADGVLIPQQFIKSGKDIYAFYYHVGEDYGKTTYIFHIPNRVRPDRTNETPEPEQQSVIDQTIAALNDAVETTSKSASDAANSAGAAEQSASSAKNDADFLRNASATATTLPEGSEATAALSNGQFAFGIPKGDTGAKGDTGNSGVYIGEDEPTDEDVGVWVDTKGSADTLIEKIKIFYLEQTGNQQFRIIDENNELHDCIINGIPTMLCNVHDPTDTKYYLYAGSFFDYIPYHVWASAPFAYLESNYTNKIEIRFLASYDFETIARNVTVNIDATVVQ